MSDKFAIHIASGKKISPHAPSSQLETQYPKDWFDKNKSKPILSLSVTSEDLATLRNQVAGSLEAQDLKIDAVNSYLYWYAYTIKDKLQEDWTSYGQVIGTAGAEKTPLSLLEVKKTTKLREGSSSKKAVEEDDPWIATALLSIYRMIRANGVSNVHLGPCKQPNARVIFQSCRYK